MPKEPASVRRPVAGTVPDTICFVGDSITLGWGDAALGGWPARLLGRLSAQGHPVTGYNLGVRGDTSGAILERWRDEVRRRRRGDDPLLVFAFGVNDAKIAADGSQTIRPALTARNTRQILADVGTSRTLMIGPAPIDEGLMQRRLNGDGALPMPSPESIALVNQKIAEEAHSAGIPFLDLLGILSSDPAWGQLMAKTDGLHPSSAGHDLLADTIGAWDAWSDVFRQQG